MYFKVISCFVIVTIHKKSIKLVGVPAKPKGTNITGRSTVQAEFKTRTGVSNNNN
jgi:hypothetical protein